MLLYQVPTLASLPSLADYVRVVNYWTGFWQSKIKYIHLLLFRMSFFSSDAVYAIGC
jgi:hypothetical protein